MHESDASPWGLMLILGIVMLSYPLLSIVNHRTMVFGVPLVLLYVFGAWAALILASLLYRPRE